MLAHGGWLTQKQQKRSAKMKKQATMVIGGLILAGGVFGAFDTNAQEPASTKTPAQVFRTDKPVKVDGVLDEPCWKQAIPVNMDYEGNGSGKRSAEPRATAKFAWDANFLYIAYETFDTNLVAKSLPFKKGPADNQRGACEISPAAPGDMVEFMIGFKDPNMFWQIYFNALGEMNDILILAGLPGWKDAKERPAMAVYSVYWAAQEFIRDDDANKLAIAVQLKPKADGKPSTVNQEGDIDTGYTSEIRFPWGGIGAPGSLRTKAGWKMAGREMSIFSAVQNGDLKERYYISSGTMTTKAFFHLQFPEWPRYVLVDAPAEAQPAKESK
jgi:hypothetical protein